MRIPRFNNIKWLYFAIGIITGMSALYSVLILIQYMNGNSTIIQSIPIIPERSMTMYIDDDVSESIQIKLEYFALENKLKTVQTSDANISITTEGNNNSTVLTQKTYVVVTAFNALHDNINVDNLSIIRTISDEKQAAHSLFPNKTITTDTTIESLISNLDSSDIAVVPFKSLTPELKVLRYNDTSYWETDDWPLVASTYIEFNNVNDDVSENIMALFENENHTKEVTDIIFTGVTAISRGVEDAIDRNGGNHLYPALGVMDVLSTADITVIDNENPFFEGCIPEREGIILCGRPESIAALEAVGADVIDMTGNHQNDYGPDKNLESIELMEAEGFEYFGGGKNEEDASATLYKTVEGTTLAFIGYNYFDSLNGQSYRSLALDDRPGSNYYTEEKMLAAVAEARKNADIVIVDYQFIETYSYDPRADQVEVFRNTADAGADIVVGVQSHAPQDIELYNDSVIIYGMGNFFFDQMWSLMTRQAYIPRIYIYDGEIISIEIYTTILHDYAQPRFVEGEDRKAILREILPGISPTPTPIPSPTPIE